MYYDSLSMDEKVGHPTLFYPTTTVIFYKDSRNVALFFRKIFDQETWNSIPQLCRERSIPCILFARIQGLLVVPDLHMRLVAICGRHSCT